MFMPFNRVADNYFSAIGIRLEGRAFDATSRERGDLIVNRGLARKLWPGQSAVGRRIRFPSPGESSRQDWHTIIGVVDDVPTRGLSGERGEPYLYYPLDPKEAASQWTLVARVTGDADPSVAFRRIVTSMDSRLPPPTVSTMASDLARTISTQRFTMVLLTVFALLAVLLSAIGLSGVISFVVTQRTREIGIRVALGATPRHVAGPIMLRGLALSLLGLGIGLLVATWGTRLIKSTLYGITPTDAASYGATAVLLLAVSLLACLLPMFRALAVDPVIAMRGE
jgi:hypothetical protein